MSVETHKFSISTHGNSEVLDLSPDVNRLLDGGKIRNGIATVFVIGSTAAITTTEFEPGLATTDLRRTFEKIAPEDDHYAHEATWHDDNGHSHVRSSLLGPSVTVPLIDGKLTLGTWQQIVLLDFDTRSRKRQIVVQVVGES